jgi:hypothetical protein
MFGAIGLFVALGVVREASGEVSKQEGVESFCARSTALGKARGCLKESSEAIACLVNGGKACECLQAGDPRSLQTCFGDCW